MRKIKMPDWVEVPPENPNNIWLTPFEEIYKKRYMLVLRGQLPTLYPLFKKYGDFVLDILKRNNPKKNEKKYVAILYFFGRNLEIADGDNLEDVRNDADYWWKSFISFFLRPSEL